MIAYSNGYWNIAEILKNNGADDTLGNNVIKQENIFNKILILLWFLFANINLLLLSN